MAVVKYRVHEVAKDFNVSNKEILDLLKDRFGGEQRNHMAALETDELNYIFEVMSQKHAVASFEPYFKAGEQARSQTESAKKARAEKEREQALLEEAKQREQAAAQAARVAPSHRDTCTSPTCALPSISMHRRLWPMPPPMVRGSLPSKSALWKASWARASQPAAFSWAARLSASTRMPMLLISIAQPSGSCQNRISPFSCQSS